MKRVAIVRLSSEAIKALNEELPKYISRQRFVGYVLRGEECRIQVVEACNDDFVADNSNRIIEIIRGTSWP